MKFDGVDQKSCRVIVGGIGTIVRQKSNIYLATWLWNAVERKQARTSWEEFSELEPYNLQKH